MADEPSTPPSVPPSTSRIDVPALLGRVGLWCTLLTALILVAVIAANVLLIVAHYPPNLALALLVLIGPTIAVVLSTVASYIGYYGTWRVVRGKDEYDVAGDLKSHAADIPLSVQNQVVAQVRQIGCLSFIPTATLAVSLVITGLTLAPPPLRTLGVIPTHGSFVPSGLGVIVPAASPSAVPSYPAAHATATATSSSPAGAIVKFTVSPTAYSGDCGHGTLSAQKITLSNGGSAAVTWTVHIREALAGTGRPWAKPSKSSGTVAPGQTDGFQLTPDGSLCRAVPPTGAALHADIVETGGATGTQTVTATITGAPR